MAARNLITSDAAADLVARMRAGERRATARVMTELERLTAKAPALLAAMAPHLGHARVIGFTGPPGAGKSTLVNALTVELRKAGRTVGIIAVDPSSPVSGGAILGDRIRMTDTAGDEGVFMRSLASRGHLGGLSPAAIRVIDALDAAGKDIVVLETVGTGQSEIDVAEVAEVRIVVGAPGLGDGIQAIKAGLLEIADILVVNKADREGAARTEAELKAALGLRTSATQEVPVLRTVASEGKGVPVLLAAIEQALSRATGSPAARRRRRARVVIARQAIEIVNRRALKSPSVAVDAICDAMLSGDLSPVEAAERLLKLG
jgi:LAO/AO transport system kinase